MDLDIAGVAVSRHHRPEQPPVILEDVAEVPAQRDVVDAVGQVGIAFAQDAQPDQHPAHIQNQEPDFTGFVGIVHLLPGLGVVDLVRSLSVIQVQIS